MEPARERVSTEVPSELIDGGRSTPRLGVELTVLNDCTLSDAVIAGGMGDGVRVPRDDCSWPGQG